MCSCTGTSKPIFYLFLLICWKVFLTWWFNLTTNLIQSTILTCCPDLWLHMSHFQGSELLTPLQQKQNNIETLVLPKEGAEGEKVAVPTSCVMRAIRGLWVSDETQLSPLCWPAEPHASLNVENANNNCWAGIESTRFASALTYCLVQSCKWKEPFEWVVVCISFNVLYL